MQTPSHRPSAASTTSATGAASASRWFWKPRLSPSPRLHLFCLPYAGGAGSLFRDWFDLVPADIDLCPIQLPGREARFTEPAIDDPRALMVALHQAIRPWLDRPFVLFGYSMGALVAHALAQHLQDTGGPLPERLVLAACSSPDHPSSVDPDILSDAGFTHHVRACPVRSQPSRRTRTPTPRRSRWQAGPTAPRAPSACTASTAVTLPSGSSPACSWTPW